jgi:type II secretory pathway pseudopilin PulG
MKTHPSRFRPASALTWIEVLVVVVVVTVLLVLLFPAVSGPREASRPAKAGTVVKNIVNACKAYANDNGRFPPVEAARDGTGRPPANTYLSFGDTGEGRCKVENSQLFNVLRAISAGSNTGDVLNKTKTRYFEENKATDKAHPREGFADGPDFPEAVRGRFLDPWGMQYCIVLDAGPEEILYLGAFYQDLGAPGKGIRKAAVAFSLGKDGKRGGKGYEGLFRKPNSDDAPDDVVSWQ